MYNECITALQDHCMLMEPVTLHFHQHKHWRAGLSCLRKVEERKWQGKWSTLLQLFRVMRTDITCVCCCRYLKVDFEDFDLNDLDCKFDVILVEPPLEEYQRRAAGVTFNWKPWSWEEVRKYPIHFSCPIPLPSSIPIPPFTPISPFTATLPLPRPSLYLVYLSCTENL